MPEPRKYIRKSVFIGLGGTGRDAVLHMKRHLINTYGEVPPTVQLLVIDTTPATPLSSGGRVSVELEGSEFYQMMVRDAAALIRNNREIRTWFDDDMPARALTQGAGQIRPLGRVALYANAAEARKRVQQVINSARSIDAVRSAAAKGYNVEGEDLQVNLICSLSGGTGSGMWYDLAYLCREQLSDIDSMVAWVLMPDVFETLPGTKNVVPNFYAAMKELDHHMARRMNEVETVSFGGRDLRIQGRPFDYIYLINKTNESGVEYSEVSELTEIIGYGLFLTTTVTGKTQRDIWDNIRDQMGGEWEGKALNYVGFGIGELTYRADRHASALAAHFLRDLIREGLRNGISRGLGSEVDNFVEKNRLREDNADDVIDAILPRARASSFPEPDQFGRGTADAVENQRHSWWAQETTRLQKEASEKAEALIASSRAALREQVEAFANRPNGLHFARNFLLELSGRFTADQQMMARERETHRHNLQHKYANAYPNLAEAIREAEGRFLGREAAVRDRFQNYRLNGQRELIEQLEIIRRERAVEVFAHLINDCELYLEAIRKSTDRLDSVLRDLAEAEEELDSTRPGTRQSSIEFPHTIVGSASETPQPSADDFIGWLRSRHQLGLLELGDEPRASVQEIFMAYAYEQPWYGQTAERSVEDILRQLQQERPAELVRLIEMMDRLAVPMWSYNRGLVAGERTTELVYAFGVQDAENTILSDPSLSARLSLTSRRPAFASTKDPSRIVMLKVRAGGILESCGS